jgi:hypothetical protein
MNNNGDYYQDAAIDLFANDYFLLKDWQQQIIDSLVWVNRDDAPESRHRMDIDHEVTIEDTI